MVKAYLRYDQADAFGVVVSSDANICYDNSGKLLVAGALEQLKVWNVKQGRAVHALAPLPSAASGSRAVVTAIACMPNSSSLVAVGYSDGSIKVWDFVEGSCETTLNGHKGAVTTVRYNRASSLLASGSKDTDIIVWDAVGEVGLFRFRGHRDQVTDLVFLERGHRLISCSKDTFVKVWDFDTQSCIQTVVGHRSEVWSIDVGLNETCFVTGSADLELRVYTINNQQYQEEVTKESARAHSRKLECGSLPQNKWEVLRHLGDIKRQSSERIVTLRFNGSGTLLGCQVAGKALELYAVLDRSDVLRRAKRRKSRKKEKALKSGRKESDGNEVSQADFGGIAEVSQFDTADDFVATDHFQLLQILRAKHKIRSFSFSPGHSKKGLLSSIALALHNNSLEVYDVQKENAARVYTIDLAGHRSDVRAAVLSSDSTILMTTSHNSVKIWNPRTCSCLRTMESGYGLCGVLVPGDRHSVVGTKGGSLEIFSITAGEQLKTVEAHSGAIWSLAALPDGSGFVSGSADHDVKFWEYELVQENDNATKQLNVRNTRTLRMAEDVLSVRISLDSKYLAIALLDSTIKVFFVDSLKFFLSLYGHKLPVLCMDISSDGALLVSGSADKNIKIWGMDFGDCHKSIFAHNDSVMAIQFVHNTHYVFSAGKDRLIKYWDADKFELLLTLEGHQAEVWCLAVSSLGDFLISGSHDRSIRRWERTDEPFFIEEEREKRLETLFEAGLDDAHSGMHMSKEDFPEEGTVGVAGKKTQESITAADSIIEALDMAEAEKNRLSMHKVERTDAGKTLVFQPNALLLGLSPSAYVLHAVSSVRPSELEQALLMLPFTDALKLLEYHLEWIPQGNQVELVCRVVSLLLRIHHQQLITTVSARPVLTLLQGILHKGVQQLKDTLGFNIAAMSHMQTILLPGSDALFKDAGKKLLEIREKHLGEKNKITATQRKQKRQKQSAA
ncbi:hypothetical protein O6H91_07G086600 [Diphasiastrum complanatum]|uniref:Uncharacterized protein n=1 Tax=Diphasiastrum complanatum TaxID=34168 RepID=A0ACC2D7L6_DIPCM|nr:hypothetical protein O6H91_07G086600 [Diphasiastrum complanatum]